MTVKSRKTAALAVVAVLALAGTALAAWLIFSSGEGAVKVGKLSAPTIATGNPTGTIYPGSTAAGTFSITNPNPMPLRITAIAAETGAANTASSSAAAACPVSNLTVNAQTGLSITVGPGSQEVAIPDAYALSENAPTGCQDAVLTRAAKLTFSTP